MAGTSPAMTLMKNLMPNPLAIDAHAHICTEDHGSS
jgi:hypothetical protein